MVDIHALKNLLNIIPYLREDTWYMLGTGSIVYIIYIAYLIAFERYYKSQQVIELEAHKSTSIKERITGLPLDDIHFFEKLSLLVRSHLEETGIVPLATKKTQKEIESSGIKSEIKEILGICAHYEYTSERATLEERREIMKKIMEVW